MKVLLYGAVTVVNMLCLGVLISVVLSAMGEETIQILLMRFALGGVVEMGLIALSLGASPLIVTFHHIVWIVVTVVAVPIVGRRVLTPTA